MILHIFMYNVISDFSVATPASEGRVNETLKKPKSQVPTSSYFAKIRSAVQDSLIVAKLQFFASTASLMVPLSSEVPNRYSTNSLHYYRSNCALRDIDAEIHKAK